MVPGLLLLTFQSTPDGQSGQPCSHQRLAEEEAPDPPLANETRWKVFQTF